MRPAEYTMLKQMSYYCPGMHGRESKQRIERRTFGDFLDSPGETKRVIVPIFQRRYCWEEVRVSRWWRDVVHGTRDHLGIHNSGNIVLHKEAGQDDWICIDGQQRMTTTSLLVAALRDAAQREPGCDSVIEKLETILYADKDQMQRFKEAGSATIKEGEDLTFCRLLPSFADRKSFFESIAEGIVDVRPQEKPMTLQLKAKRFFDTHIEAWLAEHCGDNSSLRILELQKLTQLTLYKMGLTLVDIQNAINMPQVFLWLQEKSLFGEGSLLMNPTPGIDFSAADLVRNLLLAPTVLVLDVDQQTEFYRHTWLEPIELKGSLLVSKSCYGSITDLLLAFVKEKGEHEHVSQLEETMMEIRKKFPKAKGEPDEGKAYAKFYSYYEMRLRRAAMLPPRLLNADRKVPKGSTGSKEEVFESDHKTIVEVTSKIVEELTDYVAGKL